jgi:uncharacterized protein DUF4412
MSSDAMSSDASRARVALGLVVTFALVGCDRLAALRGAGADGGVAAAEAGASAPVSPVSAAAGGNFEGELTITVDVKPGGQKSQSQYFVKGNRVRWQNTGMTGYTLFHTDVRKAYIVTDQVKSYLETPYTDTRKATNVTAKRTGKSQTIAGRSCEVWDATKGAQKGTLCMSRGILWVDPQKMGIIAGDSPDERYFPLVIDSVEGGKTTHWEVVKIDARALDDALFKIPDGYKSFGAGVGFPK